MSFRSDCFFMTTIQLRLDRIVSFIQIVKERESYYKRLGLGVKTEAHERLMTSNGIDIALSQDGISSSNVTSNTLTRENS